MTALLIRIHWSRNEYIAFWVFFLNEYQSVLESTASSLNFVRIWIEIPLLYTYKFLSAEQLIYFITYSPDILITYVDKLIQLFYFHLCDFFCRILRPILPLTKFEIQAHGWDEMDFNFCNRNSEYENFYSKSEFGIKQLFILIN